MQIKRVTDASFRTYGRVLDVNTASILKAMEKTPVPEDVVYVPGDEGLESVKDFYDTMTDVIYGGLKVQIGYCNGHNQLLNAVEYHRSSEINVAATDLILLIGKQQDIADDFTYDTANIEAYLVPKGTAIEVYATTLHYAPCGVDGAGFQCVVVLPYGTNFDYTPKTGKGEDILLAAANKWLIAHKDAKIAGAFEGLYGDNVRV